MKKEFAEKVDKISEKIDLCNKSVAWWEKLVMDVVDELDLIRSKPSSAKSVKRDRVLTERLSKLVQRGDLELRVINKLEKEFDDLIKNESRQRQTKKKSPPKRKDV